MVGERRRNCDAVAQSLIESTSASHHPATHLATPTANDVDEMAIVGRDAALDPDHRHSAAAPRRLVASPAACLVAIHSARRRHTSIVLRRRLIINNLISATVCAHIE